MVASSWSGLFATPPPMTISDGLKKFTTLASIDPTRRPAAWSSAIATGSPNEAARATSSAVTVPRWSRAARSRGLRPSSAAGLASPADRRAAGERLETADVAAAAHDRRIVHDLDVADVAGAPLRAAMEVAVRDDPGADAGPDLDDDDVVVAGRDARAPLAEGQDVDVVVDPDRRAVAGGEPLADRIAVPAGHDRRRDRPAGVELHRTRHADADPPQPAGQVAASSAGATRTARRRGPGTSRGRPRSGPARRGDPGSGRPVSSPPRRCWSRRGRRPGRSRRPRGTSAGAAAGRPCWARLALGDEPAFDQLADPLGDDGAAQTGPLDQLGARPRSTEAGSRRGPRRARRAPRRGPGLPTGWRGDLGVRRCRIARCLRSMTITPDDTPDRRAEGLLHLTWESRMRAEEVGARRSLAGTPRSDTACNHLDCLDSSPALERVGGRA